MKRLINLFLMCFGVILIGCQESASQEDQTPQVGGTLNIAVSAQPPSLDGHISTAIISMEISRNIFETLVALDDNLEPQPLLAESVERSEDGKTYTFHLRQGVKFHNGKEMTAEDVVASMNRWLEKSPLSAIIGKDAFTESDPYTVTIDLEEPVSDLLDIMAGLGRGQYTPIMPKEVIEAAPDEGIKEFIGTGPFKFKEWKQDQYIHLVKYDEYQPVDMEPSGISGKREAIVDEVFYYFVPDDSTRIAGIQTGEYDIADNMPFESYTQLKEAQDIQMFVAPSGTHNLVYNKQTGMMAHAKMRQAVNAALNMEEIMLASFSHEDLYELEPGYMSADQISWSSDAGAEFYNQGDAEKAMQLAAEAGYNGEELTILVTRDYDYHYNAAVVIQEQLTQAGFNVNLEVYDWSTMLDRRSDPESWDMFVTSTAFVTSPSQLLVLDSNWAGWTNDPKITELMDSIRLSTTHEEAKSYWDELHQFLWEDYVPLSILGHHHRIVTARDHVQGLKTFPGAIPWNTSVHK